MIRNAAICTRRWMKPYRNVLLFVACNVILSTLKPSDEYGIVGVVHAQYGGYGGFPGGGFPGGMGGGNFDYNKMFQEAQRSMGGGFPGGMGGGFPGGMGGGFPGSGDYERILRENGMDPNMFNGMGGGYPGGGMGGGYPGGGMGGGFPGGGMGGGYPGGGYPNMGGFPGGGGQQGYGGQGYGGQQGHQHQRHQQAPPKPKDDPSGVAPVQKSNFPNSSTMQPWLILFYDKDDKEEGSVTPKYISLAKKVSEGVLKKAKNNKNNMVFRVGAVDCSTGDDTRFCQQKLGLDVELPAFATVMNGSVKVVSDPRALKNPKKLHDHTTDALVGIDGLVVNVNSMQHIQTRLLSNSPTPGHSSISVILFTDKYETSPLYASLAYRHRQDGFVSFGESRGSNMQLGDEFYVNKFPTLLALIGSDQKVEKYDGPTNDIERLSSWVAGLPGSYAK